MNSTPLCGIYSIKNLINNQYYIGQAVDIKRRWRREKYELNCEEQAWNLHLQRAWNKYGAENFEFSVVELCSQEQLDEREKFWILFYDAYHNGYNQSMGGGGVRGWKHTEESLAKLSSAHKDKMTPERREKARATTTEYWSNEENRQQLSDLKKQWWENPDNKEKMREAMSNMNRTYRLKK